MASSLDSRGGQQISALQKVDSAFYYFSQANHDYHKIGALLNRTSIHYDLGQYNDFKEDALLAYELAKNNLPDSVFKYGLVLHNMALYSKITGDFHEAINFYNTAINNFQKNYDKTDNIGLKYNCLYYLVTSLINKGIIFRDKNEYYESKKYFKRALNLLLCVG